jgi:thioredoxin reductase (NADPH)
MDALLPFPHQPDTPHPAQLGLTHLEVHLIIRRPNLASSMSSYLIDQIDASPHIRVRSQTEVTALAGEQALNAVELRAEQAGETSVLAVGGLFVFTGARPSTAWLAGQLALDSHGFVLTGADICRAARPAAPPLLLETSCPGVFCVGDVRSGSVKRVAAAIGEGSTAVRLVFDRLAATPPAS